VIEFLTDRWSDIQALNAAQWQAIVVLSIVIGFVLFVVFNWFCSQRFEAQSSLISLQKERIEFYAGQHSVSQLPAPKDESATLIIPDEWEPYLDQAAEYLESELDAWQTGQQGANRLSADLGFIQDARLFQTYVRLYERLAPPKRAELRREQQDWLDERRNKAEEAVISHGGTLAPLEFNLKFIEVTVAKIKELEDRLSTT
jgi:uncharacterized protein YecT (DUF1311 family)